MAALINPDGYQIVTTLSQGGGGGNLGRWSAAQIDTYIADTNNLLNVVNSEYLYAVELLNLAGLDETNLNTTEYSAATRGMIYAIAYRLLEIDLQSQENIPAEPDMAHHVSLYRQRMNDFWRRAGYAWKEINIDSKYWQSATIGFGATTFVDLSPNALTNFNYGS